MKTQDAIDFFGSHKAVADALGIWPQAVYRWGENVPPLRAFQLREIMERKVKREAALDELVRLSEEAGLYDVDKTEFERRCAANEEENRMVDY